jgi:hypothetical protein
MAKDESILPLLAELPRPRVILRPIDGATATRRNTPASPIALLLLRGASEVDGAVLFSISIQPLASSVMGMVVLIFFFICLNVVAIIVVGVLCERRLPFYASFESLTPTEELVVGVKNESFQKFRSSFQHKTISERQRYRAKYYTYCKAISLSTKFNLS